MKSTKIELGRGQILESSVVEFFETIQQAQKLLEELDK